ncbi:MAG: hypothetical protein IAE90_02000 [Ignavibacteria bacterium]|nr:hypothetical protein [Ignavibacteria bacterium]
MLQWEASLANYNTSPLKFYIETIEFNNLPCIAYVNKKLQSMGANVDIMTDLTHLYSTHVDWSDRATVMNAEHIKRFYIDSAGFKQILFESYPFTSAYFEEPAAAAVCGYLLK